MWMLLDSGAFSAWTKKIEVDLDDYMVYIYKNMDVVNAYVNLDAIPGEFGRTPTEEEVEVSAQKGWDNMLYMQGFGLDPIPVFHQGERMYWLERMVDHGCAYIGISPANDRSTKAKIEWLDRVFNFLCDEEGNCRVKTHAFGATSAEIILRYPWETVDSTTWKQAGSMYGLIRVPRMGLDGNWDMTKRLTTLRISAKAPKVEGHFDLLSDAEKANVVRFIEYSGTTLEKVIHEDFERDIVNAKAFKMLSDAHLKVKFKRTANYLFEEP